MFTGIVEETGIIKSIQHSDRSSKLTISALKVLDDIKAGDSINTNGVCLTVVAFGNNYFQTEVMPETLRRTSFRTLKTGSAVNLERALRLSDRLGGHLVSGHIDGTGRILRRWEEDIAVWFNISADAAILRYIIEKGSVALDGISLTIASTDKNSFSVSVIPHTSLVTTIMKKRAGDLVNIECDMIAKYIEKLSSPESSRSKIDLNFLAKNNFL
jgi:riboflavin synthase